MSTMVKTEHPHVHRNTQGRPVVGPASLEVHVLAGYWKLGWTVQELADSYPYLKPAESLDALSYFHDHEEEITALIDANRPAVTESDG